VLAAILYCCDFGWPTYLQTLHMPIIVVIFIENHLVIETNIVSDKQTTKYLDAPPLTHMT
jgi:hypothetical protein